LLGSELRQSLQSQYYHNLMTIQILNPVIVGTK